MTTFNPEFKSYVDENAREFNYVRIDNNSSTTVIHFSAFFGEWGDRAENRKQFKGYFHRLKMLGVDERYNWLFLCDTFGADQNGTYYFGEDGDDFVFRAMNQIFLLEGLSSNSNQKVITVGSSMGATGALVFGLNWKAKGIIAICPHIDLDTSALTQDRMRHVLKTLRVKDLYAESERNILRPVARQLSKFESELKLPTLFIQSCKDDHGVHYEQVLPLIEAWSRKGGSVSLDERDSGGHTSEYATKELLLSAISKIAEGEELPIKDYANSRRYQPKKDRKAKRAGFRLLNLILAITKRINSRLAK